MESIYGDNVFILDRHSGLRSFQVSQWANVLKRQSSISIKKWIVQHLLNILQIHIHIETQGEVSITAKLNSSGDFETKRDNSDDFSYSFEVQYLPPILLTCILPKSYPSHLPPYFTISVQWLGSSRISNLCSMLDTIWREQLGQEVMYQWVEWLQISSLSHLGFDKAIMLGPYGIRHAGDRRGVSGTTKNST